MALGEPSISASRARLLDRIRERIELARDLGAGMRAALRTADVEAIEVLTGRLETALLELKLLTKEFRLAPPASGDGDDPELRAARRRLEQSVLALARSTAVDSGLLERLVALSRGLMAAVRVERGEGYRTPADSDGVALEGLRLRQTV